MRTTTLIIGNLCTLMAMGSNAISATRKTKNGILWTQSISQLIYLSSALVLRGYSAAVQNVVSIVRNLAAIRNIRNAWLEWFLVGLAAVLGIVFNNRGLIGLLPVIGNLQYTIVIFRLRDKDRALKFSFWISTLCFAIFNVTIFNFVGVLSDLVVLITTGIVLLKPEKKA